VQRLCAFGVRASYITSSTNAWGAHTSDEVKDVFFCVSGPVVRSVCLLCAAPSARKAIFSTHLRLSRKSPSKQRLFDMSTPGSMPVWKMFDGCCTMHFPAAFEGVCFCRNLRQKHASPMLISEAGRVQLFSCSSVGCPCGQR